MLTIWRLFPFIGNVALLWVELACCSSPLNSSQSEDRMFERESKGSFTRFVTPLREGRYRDLLRHCFIHREGGYEHRKNWLYRMSKYPQILQVKRSYVAVRKKQNRKRKTVDQLL